MGLVGLMIKIIRNKIILIKKLMIGTMLILVCHEVSYLILFTIIIYFILFYLLLIIVLFYIINKCIKYLN
jgi:hypothetical protein